MSDEPQDPFHDLRLTEWTSCGGCAAKWGAALLVDLVRDMPAGSDPALLVGLAPFDDAAIYQVTPDVIRETCEAVGPNRTAVELKLAAPEA